MTGSSNVTLTPIRTRYDSTHACARAYWLIYNEYTTSDDIYTVNVEGILETTEAEIVIPCNNHIVYLLLIAELLHVTCSCKDSECQA